MIQNQDSMYAGYQKVDYAEPHIGRAKQLLAAHPELKKLFGNTPSTFLHILFLVFAQVTIGALLIHQPWWLMLAVAWLVGALLNHACFVMIHDATHNLVFKSTVANRYAGMVANLPIIFPAAMGFRTFHLLHHRYQGEFAKDADLAGPNEAKWVGTSPVRKTIWLLFFFLVEALVRPARLDIKFLDRWSVINVFMQVAFVATVVLFLGWVPVIYMVVSALFSVGLHPVGARWIQEHYTTHGSQETYSYYGPLNFTCYNVGYHNEHHDLMMVPWSKLPKVKEMAPEFYDNLHSYRSWTKLLFQFIFSKDLSLYSRVVRPSREERTSTSEMAHQMAAAEKVEDRLVIQNA